jgi:hypothetical protein
MHMNKALHALSQQLLGYKISTAAFHSLASPRPNFRALVAAALDESTNELRDKRLHVAGDAYEDVFEYIARPASHVGCGGGSVLGCDG